MSEKSNDQGPRRSASGRQRSRGAGDQPRRYSKAAPSQRTRRADPARLAAFRTVTAVSRDDAYANLVLPEQIRRAKLDKRDAGFATELTYGTLRAAGTYDRIIGRCIDRKIADLDAPVLDALRLGAHQLLAMRTDDHAAVNETVSLVRDQIGATRRLRQRCAAPHLPEVPGGVDRRADRGRRPHRRPRSALRTPCMGGAGPSPVPQAPRARGRARGSPRGRQRRSRSPPRGSAGPRRRSRAGGPRLSGGGLRRPSRLIDGAAVHHGGDVGRLPVCVTGPCASRTSAPSG